LDAVKKKLGLPETATDAEIEAALEAAELAAPAEPAAPAEGAAPAAAAAAVEPAAVAEPAAAELGEGAPQTVTVTAVQFAAMQSELATLTSERAADRKKNALDSAIKTGRIAPAERVAFAATLEANEEAGIALLASLAPRFSVIELGADHAPAAAADEADLERQAIEAGL
jgi:phage I-like protein